KLWKRSPPLEAREAGPLSPLQPPQERLIGLLQAGQDVVEHVAVDGGVLRERCPDRLQLGFPLVARDGGLTPLPGREALFEGYRVEPTAPPQDTLELPLLVGSGLERVLAGLGQAVLVQSPLFGLAAARSATGRSCWLKPYHASPPGLQPSGLRRAQALFCQG